MSSTDMALYLLEHARIISIVPSEIGKDNIYIAFSIFYEEIDACMMDVLAHLRNK